MFGSFVPALLWGVAVVNLLRGLPIDYQMHFTGHFFDLLNPCALLGGVFFVLLFAFHGANFLLIKIADEGLLHELQQRSVCLGISPCEIEHGIFLGLDGCRADCELCGRVFGLRLQGVPLVDVGHCVFDNRLFQRAVSANHGVEYRAGMEP